MNPNHQVTWQRTRPDFSIECTRSTSTNRGYHESHYIVISSRELDADAWKHLDAAGLTGSGQAYHVQAHTTFEDVVPPVVIDRRTGKRVECDCQLSDGHLVGCEALPRSHNGEPFTKTTSYAYHKYTLLRICDSGD